MDTTVDPRTDPAEPSGPLPAAHLNPPQRQVQATCDLRGGAWSNVGAAVSGDGATHVLEEDLPAEGFRYYRINRVLPSEAGE